MDCRDVAGHELVPPPLELDTRDDRAPAPSDRARTFGGSCLCCEDGVTEKSGSGWVFPAALSFFLPLSVSSCRG